MRFPGHETVSIGNRVRVNVALLRYRKVFAFATSCNYGTVYINIALDNKNVWKSLDCGMVAMPCTTEEKHNADETAWLQDWTLWSWRGICDLTSNFAKHFLNSNDLYGFCLAEELSVISYFV